MTKTFNRSIQARWLGSAGVVAIGLITATAASAQQSSTNTPVAPVQPNTPDTNQAVDPSGAPAAVASTGAGEIIVTAQKRSEKLQNVPISISAVSGAQLAQKSIATVSQLSQSVPALRLDYAGNTVQPTIRGVGSSVAGPGLTSNIGIYVDGFYVPSPTSSDVNLFDVESVNVLKGPQGTLFGYNATGGAIQISTRAPQQATDIVAKVGYASFNDATAAVFATTGLTPTLSASISASYEHSDNYLRNIVTGNRNAGRFHAWSVHPKLKWEPSDAVSFTLAYQHTFNNDPTLNYTVARDGNSFGSVIPGNIIATDRRQVSNNAPNYNEITTNSYTLTSNFKLGFADLTSYTGYRTDKVSQGLDYDASPANIDAAQWTIPDKTFTQEVDLTSKPGGRFNWVIGGFYMHLKDTYNYNLNTATSTAFDGSPYFPLFTSTNTTESYAVFADGTYEILDNLFLTAGGRYSHDHVKLAFDLFPASFADSGSTDFHNFSARGVVRYQLTPQSNVYASYTQGYKAGALPGSSFSFTPVKPEKIDAYEVGYKIANRLIRFSAAGFYYNYKDIQVTSFGAGGVSTTRNAAAAHIYGLDGELTLQLTPDFSVNTSAAYTHAKYHKFTDAIGYAQDLNPLSATYGQFNVFNVDASGFPTQRTPRFSGSVGGNYALDVANGRLNLNANLFYTSHFYFDAVKQLPQKHYALLNLKATWTDPSKHFDFSVYGTNVTNTKYYIANFTDTFASRAVYGAPAVVGGSVTFHY